MTIPGDIGALPIRTPWRSDFMIKNPVVTHWRNIYWLWFIILFLEQRVGSKLLFWVSWYEGWFVEGWSFCVEIQMSITFILKKINIFSFYDDSTNFFSEKRGGSNLLLGSFLWMSWYYETLFVEVRVIGFCKKYITESTKLYCLTVCDCILWCS